MNKIVINRCYGGFGISRKAAERLLELGFKDSQLEKELNNEKYYSYNSYYPEIPRHHPLLVQVVEELGTRKASGSGAELEVIEIEGNLYNIDEYDGYESISTPNTISWIDCNIL